MVECFRKGSARVAPEKRTHPGPPADLPQTGITTREVVVKKQAKRTKSAARREGRRQQHPELTEELKAEIETQYPVARRPMKHALVVAATERSIRLAALVPSEGPSLDRVVPALSQIKELLRELTELVQWVEIPVPESERLNRNRAAIDALSSAGLSPHQIVEASLALQVSPRGRPVTKRYVAADALDMWLVNPRWSWARVTREVCNCGRTMHGPVCQENLRQQINDLRALLKEYGIKEPPRKSPSAVI
jgi:hypothetical protein